MRLAISNIAWPVEEDESIARLLQEQGVEGIEIAPTKWWPQPLAATPSEIADRRRFWESRGVAIIAAQALLFGKSDFQLFGTAAVQQEMQDYLKGIIDLCASLGAKPLVFGSPKNRRRGDLSLDKANAAAREFFLPLADHAAKRGACISMEANPPYYSADYVTTVADAIELVRSVNHPGFRLQIDTACMGYVGDESGTLTAEVAPLIAHFHASEPNLAELGTGGVPHQQFADTLAQIGYDGWISIEMRAAEPFSIDAIDRAIAVAKRTYVGRT